VVISKTPVRLSFFGGGTDYPDYFKRKKCAVLGTTIDKYIYVTINHGSPFFDHRIRVSYSKSETVNEISEIEHPSVRAILQFLKMDELLDIHIVADLPARTGLGSSSAFTVCFLNACYAHKGIFAGKERLAAEAIHIEQDLLGESVGIQDQIHAAYGGLNTIRADSHGMTVFPAIMSPENRALLESSLLLFYTRMTRSANEIVQEQIANTRKLELDGQLEVMASQVDEAQEVLARTSGPTLLRRFGEMLNVGWQLKKQLSTQITNSAIDHYYSEAVKHGALGGKIGGAGGGGFLMLVVDKQHQPAVRAALKELEEVPIKFENNGASIIYSTEPPTYLQHR